jgi:hypothetical protein
VERDSEREKEPEITVVAVPLCDPDKVTERLLEVEPLDVADMEFDCVTLLVPV